MHIAIQAWPLLDWLGVDEGYQALREAGFAHCDFGMGRFFHKTQRALLDEPLDAVLAAAEPYRAGAKKYGITISQTHAPFPCWEPEKDVMHERMIAVTEKCLALTAFMDSKYCVVHPAHTPTAEGRLSPEEEWAINKEFYTALIPALKKYQVVCCLENMIHKYKGQFYMGSACSNPQVTAKWIDELNAIAGEEVFGFCFDTGHAHVARLNQRHFLSSMGKRTKVLHVHDNMGDVDQHLAPYMGNIDWDQFALGLKEAGYEGEMFFETFKVLTNHPREMIPTCLKMMAETGRSLIEKIENA